MKKLVSILVLVLATAQQSNAQQESFLNKVSLEAGYGYNLAVSPDNIDAATVSGFNTVQLGATYQLNTLWGVRGTYANTTFKDKDVSRAAINYNKITLEATFNMVEAISGVTNSPFEVVAHAGFGLNFGKSETIDAVDKIANAQIGIKPQYQITNRVAVFVDGAYIMNLKQNYGFNGMHIPGESETTGSYITGLVGVAVKLGK